MEMILEVLVGLYCYMNDTCDDPESEEFKANEKEYSLIYSVIEKSDELREVFWDAIDWIYPDAIPDPDPIYEGERIAHELEVQDGED